MNEQNQNTSAVTLKCDAEAVEMIVAEASLECAASMWGYCHGGSAGATDEIRYFKRNAILPGHDHCINQRMRPIIERALTQALQSRDAENARLNERVRELEREAEEEQGRWQDAIYNLLRKRCPDADIDGKGCDSGDPLDFTLTEVSQALNHLEEERDRLSAELARVKKAGSKMEAALQRTLDVYPIMAMKAGVKGDIEDALKEYRNWKENSNMLTPEQREEME